SFIVSHAGGLAGKKRFWSAGRSEEPLRGCNSRRSGKQDREGDWGRREGSSAAAGESRARECEVATVVRTAEIVVHRSVGARFFAIQHPRRSESEWKRESRCA